MFLGQLFSDMLVSGGCKFFHILQTAAVFFCRVPTFSPSVPQPLYQHSRKWNKVSKSLAATSILLLAKTEQVPQNIIHKIKQGGAVKDLTLSWQHWPLSQAYTLLCCVLLWPVPEEVCFATYATACWSSRFFNFLMEVQTWANLFQPDFIKFWWSSESKRHGSTKLYKT